MFILKAEAAGKSLEKHGAASYRGDLTLDIYLIKKVLELIIIVDLESESIVL
ncbi:unnamed protein product [Brassica rapa subsp. trilocularis]